MYKKVLIATDGKALAAKAVDCGLRLAKQLGAEATVVRVTPNLAVYVAEYGDIPAPKMLHRVGDLVRKHLQLVHKSANEVGVPCKTLHVKDNRAWHAIIETARSERCDVIVMASHGRDTISAAFLGSETQKVLAHSFIPVLVVR